MKTIDGSVAAAVQDPSPTRVMVVDDVDVMRDALADLLRCASGVEVVGVASDGREAVETYRSFQPDVIVIDMRMPRMDGISATREISKEGPPPYVLMLSAYGDESLVCLAIEAGASSFMLKDTPPHELVEAVIATARGARCFADELAGFPIEESVGAARGSTVREEI
jgi:DNA-binding NarL/FixJ family response regulator